MSGVLNRRKGDRVERDFVKGHKAIGVYAERYPLSGASQFRGSGHDLDIYALGECEAPLFAEVKSRANGTGFTTLEKWLGTYDAPFLRRNGADPLVLVPWRIWARIFAEVRR
jgi:Holliday junction resolvase